MMIRENSQFSQFFRPLRGLLIRFKFQELRAKGLRVKNSASRGRKTNPNITRTPEAIAVEPIVGGEVEAAGPEEAVGIAEVPRTAPHHPIHPISSRLRWRQISPLIPVVRFFIIPVLTPLPHVPRHLI
jgi:hypothetical protein